MHARASRGVAPTPLAIALLQDALAPAHPSVQAVKALLRRTRPHHHRQGTQILSRDEVAESLWMVASGQAALGVVEDRRMVQQTRLVSPGEWLDAGSALLGEGASYMEDAIAETSLTVWSLPLADLLRCGLEHPRLLHGLAAVLAARVSNLLGMQLSLVRQPVEARLATWLLGHAGRGPAADGRQVLLNQRKRALASQLGTTPETFSRMLRQWGEQGLVSVQGYTIRLIDEAALCQRAALRR